jgi:hypothetical protein
MTTPNYPGQQPPYQPGPPQPPYQPPTYQPGPPQPPYLPGPPQAGSFAAPPPAPPKRQRWLIPTLTPKRTKLTTITFDAGLFTLAEDAVVTL